MNKFALIGTIFLTVSTFATSSFAMGRGMGGGMGGGSGGSGMMNNFGSGLLDWLQKSRNENQYTTPSGQSRERKGELDKQHDEDSAYLKYQIKMKEKELDALLNMKDPDISKVRALRKDIRDLESLSDQEQQQYDLGRNKLNPGYQSGSNNFYPWQK